MTPEAMKTLGRVAIQAWNEGRPDLLDEVYAPNYRNHFNGETLDMLKQSLLATRAAFSGFTVTIDDQIVEGDKGVTRWTARGVHTGEHLGIPATGRPVEITGINIGRFENGKIVDEWARGDDVGLLRQLGVLP
ncbi:MAG TPA: ester cyclase [Chloroflexi bacterium]|nr:ester cyclase [Chloroflexota bacterium]